MRTLIGCIILLGGYFAVRFALFYRKAHTNKIATLELRDEVLRIRYPDPKNRSWLVAELSGGKEIVLENDMRGKLAVGDSLFKKKGRGILPHEEARHGAGSAL